MVVFFQPGVRLTRNNLPSTTSNGYLQVYDHSTKRWGPVCGATRWGNRQRTEACEQLGYGPTYSVSYWLFALLSKNTRRLATSPSCVSSINKIVDCNKGVYWGASTCPRSSDNLYISCQKRKLLYLLCANIYGN